jgi:hypothetical protein
MAQSDLTAAQNASLSRVLAGLRQLGYDRDLLKPNYQFNDWFEPGAPERTVDAAAFGRTPALPDSACFAVVASNGQPSLEAIRKCRALCAPRALEVDRNGKVAHWRVGVAPVDGDRQEIIQPGEIEDAFRDHRDQWSPDFMLRMKNIGPVGPRQLDFIDIGLMPALEDHVREKLDPLLRTTLHAAKTEYHQETGRRPDDAALFQLVFRALTGKIMHDREVRGFVNGRRVPDADDFLERVARHYNEPERTAIQSRRVRQVVLEQLWSGVNLKYISVETLAYIWENLLLAEGDRDKLSIHATPPSLARYVVHRLPFTQKTGALGPIVEPCCGAGTFLIAAMQRMRDLLPRDMSDEQRHTYFKEKLWGFDIESFGLEVAKCGLLLADIPHPNKWNLYKEDVFGSESNSPNFRRTLSRASAVLCNPPFGSLSPAERKKYDARSHLKPVELMSRVIEFVPRYAMLGFVMPLQLLTGKSYRIVRTELAARFQDIEIVSLPDKVFAKAEQETALVIAHGGRSGVEPVRFAHRKVEEAGWPAFRDRFEVSSEAKGVLAPEDASLGLAIPDLPNVWAYLAGLPRLKDVKDLIRRGIEWNVKLDDNYDKLIADREREGFRRGLPSAPRGEFLAYQCPPTKYLCVKPEFQLYKAFDLPWRRPKVVMSAKRKSRSAWRIAAFPDRSGLVCYQTFTCVWPTAGWSVETLAAILNSPVANAFVAAREGNRDITNETVAEIPVPIISTKTAAFVDRAVAELVHTVAKKELTRHEGIRVRELLTLIDAVIVKAYALPRDMEQQLLAYFQGAEEERPVPVDSWNYSSEDLDRTYDRVKDLLEPAGEGPTESWEYLKTILDENRLSDRKFFQ